MISISTTTANTAGNVIIYNVAESKLNERTARISRTQTLDGGVYINHSGYTDGDRTLHIKSKIDSSQAVVLTALFESYTILLISMFDGLYLAVISALNIEDGFLRMTVLLKSKEN